MRSSSAEPRPLRVVENSGTWFFALASWALQDGTIPEVRVGQIYDFGLEFAYSLDQRLRATNVTTRDRRYAGQESFYDVRGRLDHNRRGSEYSWELDFGVVASKAHLTLANRITPVSGAWVSGRIRLAVAAGQKSPNYRWEVNGITVETSPPSKTRPTQSEAPGSRPEHDKAITRWEPLTHTERWRDATYLLECTLRP